MNIRKAESELDDEINLLLNFSKGAKTRRKILESLRHCLKNCNQIAKEIKADWWTIHKHLQRLKKAGLIKSVNFGMVEFYRLTSTGEEALKFTSQNHFKRKEDT